ncbi:hypothetical protein OPV22_005332 [Ensete ventricosum]|uniref:Uncharacterized protein n=1 Tax=Ensete ventricosum TaxID=4639 RepID=A0AAV8Q2I6_ENSVE|nr:hypothetical protein OPV22_005332 [Ensete ventricosum]
MLILLKTQKRLCISWISIEIKNGQIGHSRRDMTLLKSLFTNVLFKIFSTEIHREAFTYISATSVAV